jgi:hypothetical protein
MQASKFVLMYIFWELLASTLISSSSYLSQKTKNKPMSMNQRILIPQIRIQLLQLKHLKVVKVTLEQPKKKHSLK